MAAWTPGGLVQATSKPPHTYMSMSASTLTHASSLDRSSMAGSTSWGADSSRLPLAPQLHGLEAVPRDAVAGASPRGPVSIRDLQHAYAYDAARAGADSPSPTPEPLPSPASLPVRHSVLRHPPVLPDATTGATVRPRVRAQSPSPVQSHAHQLDAATSKVLQERGIQVTEYVGKGSFGAIFKGVWNNRRIALKVVKSVAEPLVREHKCHDYEAQIHRRLKHPNIADCLKYFSVHGTLYIILEYCGGGNLLKYAPGNGKRLRTEHVAVIVKQVLVALDYMHQLGYAHRDIKLANILIDSSRQVKLADFGLVGLLDSVHTTICGTAPYMAPEVESGSKYDGRAADVYSVGVVATSLLLGEVLPRDMTHLQLLSVLTRLDGRSNSGASFCRACCQTDPERRLTVEMAMNHPFLKRRGALSSSSLCSRPSNVRVTGSERSISEPSTVSPVVANLMVLPPAPTAPIAELGIGIGIGLEPMVASAPSMARVDAPVRESSLWTASHSMSQSWSTQSRDGLTWSFQDSQVSSIPTVLAESFAVSAPKPKPASVLLSQPAVVVADSTRLRETFQSLYGATPLKMERRRHIMKALCTAGCCPTLIPTKVGLVTIQADGCVCVAVESMRQRVTISGDGQTLHVEGGAAAGDSYELARIPRKLRKVYRFAREVVKRVRAAGAAMAPHGLGSAQ